MKRVFSPRCLPSLLSLLVVLNTAVPLSGQSGPPRGRPAKAEALDESGPPAKKLKAKPDAEEPADDGVESMPTPRGIPPESEPPGKKPEPEATAANNGDRVGPPDKKDQDTIVQIQCFLDQQKWGPGKIDGALGEFTTKGVNSYNALHGYSHGDWANVLEEARREIAEPYTEYTVKEGDLKFITSGFTTSPAAQSKMKYLGYSNLTEFVAERFHTDDAFVKKLNPKVSIKVGSVVKVPNVAPFEIEDLPKSKKYEEDDKLSKRVVLVDTKAKIATFYEDEKLIASFPITPGQEKFIHRGTWKVTNMVTFPTFRWDKGMLERGKRTDDFYELPPGPNSPVGVFWTGTNKTGIGLHGTVNPRTIGRAQSAGCIRFANWDAVRLPELIRPGAKVVIR